MKKIPAIILLVILTVFIVLFLFFPNILTTTKEIAGCMDRTSESFDPLANVHDSTMCSSNRKQPTKELEESVDSLRNSSWNKDKYDHIRSSILSYFSSEGKSGTDDEENSLHNLDAVYMSVLYGASKKSSKKCFSNYSNIKNEVDKFYKKYKNNKDIRNARGLLSNRGKARSYQSKVKSLLSKRYDKSSYNDLKNDIIKFMNSGDYKKYIKNCKKLKLDQVLTDLNNYSQIEFEYNNFQKTYKKNKLKWTLNKKVPTSYLIKFRDYKWYYNQVTQINNSLKLKNNKKNIK
jgi:hypothetical protein